MFKNVPMGNCGFGVAPAKPDHRRLLMQTLENVEGMSLESLEEGLAAWPFESFPQYLDAIERRGTAINVGAMVGHSAVRLHVMGLEATERTAEPGEVEAMAQIVGEATAAGALGFSTSTCRLHVGFAGKPVPSRFADMASETIPLAEVVGQNGGGVVQLATGIEPVELDVHQMAEHVHGRLEPQGIAADEAALGLGELFFSRTSIPIVPDKRFDFLQDPRH